MWAPPVSARKPCASSFLLTSHWPGPVTWPHVSARKRAPRHPCSHLIGQDQSHGPTSQLRSSEPHHSCSHLIGQDQSHGPTHQPESREMSASESIFQSVFLSLPQGLLLLHVTFLPLKSHPEYVSRVHPMLWGKKKLKGLGQSLHCITEVRSVKLICYSVLSTKELMLLNYDAGEDS